MGHQLSVLVAQNGTGKTTLLNAITWCLYGNEKHLANEESALPIVNTSVLKNAADAKRVWLEAALEDSLLEDSKKNKDLN